MLIDDVRVWQIGYATAFQAAEAGSIPVARSTKKKPPELGRRGNVQKNYEDELCLKNHRNTSG